VLQRTGCHWQAFSYYRCSSHIRIQVSSYHIADYLLLTSNLQSCCRCTCYWQTSLIKIATFFAFSLIHSYRLSRPISSPCHRYRYPPRSTEPIPLVLHPVVLQISSRIAVTLHHPRSCRLCIPMCTKSSTHIDPVLPSRTHGPHFCHLDSESSCLPSRVAGGQILRLHLTFKLTRPELLNLKLMWAQQLSVNNQPMGGPTGGSWGRDNLHTAVKP
jgi:hypothetical protein